MATSYETVSPSRDLGAAREAYDARALDPELAIELSRKAHNMPDEIHAEGGNEYVKNLVFGGLDGTITTFAIVSAAAGASMSPNTVIVMGIANVIADAISMGLGDYISESAERDFVKKEYAREEWELDNYPEGEVSEMSELYVEKYKFSKEDADQILAIMSKNKRFFLDHMMHVELGLMTDDLDEGGAYKKSLVMFFAFIIFGCMPLMAYFVLSPFGVDPNTMFLASIVMTGITLMALGFSKAVLTKQPRFKAAMYMLANGSIAAFAAYITGWCAEQIFHDEGGLH